MISKVMKRKIIGSVEYAGIQINHKLFHLEHGVDIVNVKD